MLIADQSVSSKTKKRYHTLLMLDAKTGRLPDSIRFIIPFNQGRRYPHKFYIDKEGHDGKRTVRLYDIITDI